MELIFDSTSTLLAAGVSDSSVRVYDIKQGFQTHNFVGHRGLILKMAFSPVESDFRLFTAGQDHSIKVWDLAMNQQVHSFDKLGAYASSFAFTNDGTVFFCGLRNGNITLWNTTEYKKLADVQSGEEEVTALCYYNHKFDDQLSKSYLMFGTSSGYLKFMDISTQKIVWKECQTSA